VKGLSLSRPWPWSFLHAASPKRIENRQRKDGRMPVLCRYRGPLLLHAAKSWDKTAAAWMADRGLLKEEKWHELFSFYEVPQAGGIFARCRAVGHIEPPPPARPRELGRVHCDISTPSEALDWRWWMGGYALILADVEPTPWVPCRGALGLWTPPPEVLARLLP
jgi:hypothetical protein